MKNSKVKIKEGLIYYCDKVFWDKEKLLEYAYDLEKKGDIKDAKELREATSQLNWKGKWGWRSQKYERMSGNSVTYSTPYGEEIKVNFVSNDNKDSGAKWEDIVCVGPVSECIIPLPFKSSNPNEYILRKRIK